MMGKTIRNGIEFERVSLTAEEMNQVHEEVMSHNVAALHDSLARAEHEFSELEPGRRLRVALFLAEKSPLHIFGAEKEALDRKVGRIKDEAGVRARESAERGGSNGR